MRLHILQSSSQCPPSPGVCQNDAATFVLRLAAGERTAVEHTYLLLQEIVGQHLRSPLPEHDPEDIIQELFPHLMESLRNGALRDPNALRGYLHSVVRNQIATRFQRLNGRRRVVVDSYYAPAESATTSDDPEQDLLNRERCALLARGLGRLQHRDSELLTRFYLRGEGHEQICLEMHLTATQFRLYKSRAKAKLTAWAKSVTCGTVRQQFRLVSKNLWKS